MKIPDVVGDYRLGAPIGSGSAGDVYRATHTRTGRSVALKLLVPSARDDQSHRGRFLRELKLLEGIEHPSLVRVLGGGETENTLYVVMELLEGVSLDKWTQRETLPLQSVLRILLQITSGLARLHQEGILHRDIKPSNIFVPVTGPAKLIDFGLVVRLDSTLVTGEGELVGTLAYMAPELIMGKTASAGSDLWSLGCVAYFLLTDRMPIMAASPADWARSVLSSEIPRPADIRDSVPGPISDLVLRLLERNEKKRLLNAKQLERELTEKIAQVGLGEPGRVPGRSSGAPSRPPPKTPALGLSMAHRPRFPGGSRIAAGLAVLALTGLAMSHRPAPRPLPPLAYHSPAPTEVSPSKALYSPPFTRWRSCLPYRSALSSLSRLPANLQAGLERVSGVHLGEDPQSWTFWINLGQRLESGQPIEIGTLARTDTDPLMDQNFELLFQNHISSNWRRFGPCSPEVLAVLLRSMCRFPAAGTLWLYLARELELEELGRSAGTLYGIALDHISTLRVSPLTLTWELVARGLNVAPRHKLETEWAGITQQWGGGVEAWHGLYDSLNPDNRRAVGHLLAVGARDPHESDGPVALWGRFQLEQLHEPDAAFTTWRDGLKRFPRSHSIAGRMAAAMIAQGRAEEATPLVSLLAPDDRTRTIWDLVSSTPADWPTVAAERRALGRPDDYWSDLELGQLLELGEFDLALKAAAHVFKYGEPSNWYEADQMLAIVGQRPDTPGFRIPVDPITLAVWTFLDDVAGNLACVHGVAEMEWFLGQMANYPPLQPSAQLTRALWLSRRHRLLDSLEILKSFQAGARWAQNWPMVQAEILMRPIWLSNLGYPVPENVLQLVKDLTQPFAGDTADLARALMTVRGPGDTGRALKLLGTMPERSPLAILAAAYSASLDPSTQTRELVFRRLRQAARSYSRCTWLVRTLRDLDGRPGGSLTMPPDGLFESWHGLATESPAAPGPRAEPWRRWLDDTPQFGAIRAPATRELWIKLGTWLDSAHGRETGGEAPLPAAVEPPSGMAWDGLMAQAAESSGDWAVEWFCPALCAVTYWPARAEGWLLLGLSLERDGLATRARAVYRTALKRDFGVNLSTWPPLLQAALARAVWMVERSPERLAGIEKLRKLLPDTGSRDRVTALLQTVARGFRVDQVSPEAGVRSPEPVGGPIGPGQFKKIGPAGPSK